MLLYMLQDICIALACSCKISSIPYQNACIVANTQDDSAYILPLWRDIHCDGHCRTWSRQNMVPNDDWLKLLRTAILGLSMAGQHGACDCVLRGDGAAVHVLGSWPLVLSRQTSPREEAARQTAFGQGLHDNQISLCLWLAAMELRQIHGYSWILQSRTNIGTLQMMNA